MAKGDQFCAAVGCDRPSAATCGENSRPTWGKAAEKTAARANRWAALMRARARASARRDSRTHKSKHIRWRKETPRRLSCEKDPALSTADATAITTTTGEMERMQRRRRKASPQLAHGTVSQPRRIRPR
eukprot:6175748-Pleurochrysis_carterae.AAC.1